MTVSVLTIARGREAHLRNLIEGLECQTRRPDELVIAVMQDRPYDLPFSSFPVRQVPAQGDPLPLSKARNAAARAAKGEALVFLDVDCIPDPTFLGDYERYLSGEEGLMMGEVMYLPEGVAGAGWTYAEFEVRGERHSERRGPPESGSDPCEDYRCFWSLNFALTRDAWQRSGGFDERYAGYGGEDTDFGRELLERGIPLRWVRGARAYHQHHAHHMPPVHHVASILRNAQVFKEKWGHHTMEHWLRAFRLMGLIERNGEGWRVLREAGDDDFALTRQQSHMPYASSARVMRQLEARETAMPQAIAAE